MDYIASMRAAVEHCELCELRAVFDYYLALALDDYRAGALDVFEYGLILDEYSETLMSTGASRY